MQIPPNVQIAIKANRFTNISNISFKENSILYSPPINTAICLDYLFKLSWKFHNSYSYTMIIFYISEKKLIICNKKNTDLNNSHLRQVFFNFRYWVYIGFILVLTNTR